MKNKLSFLFHAVSFLSVLSALFASCNEDDDYYYPSVKQEFLTAVARVDGSLQSVLTDEGITYVVLEDATNTHLDANASVRIVSNYGMMLADDGTSGVKLYNLLQAISPQPQPAANFKEGVKTDPAAVQSIWMGLNYLNVILEIKAQNGKHLFHFVEERVEDMAGGIREVDLLLYHDAGNDVQAYTKRAYVSVPLRQYAVEGITKVVVHFSLNTYSDGVKTYSFYYSPK